MLFLTICLFSLACYFFAKKKIVILSQKYNQKPKDLPGYYGTSFAIWNFMLSIVILLAMFLYEKSGNRVNYTYAYLSSVSVFIIMFTYILYSLKGRFRAKSHCEILFKWILSIASLISVLVTFSIFITIVFEAIKFFTMIPIEDFLLGIKWSPQSNNLNENIFGIIPVFTGTLLITSIAILIALPLGLLSAIYLREYTSISTRNKLKPILELLAGIPTIVYGYFAVLVVGPFIRVCGEIFGLEISTESALSAGIVMGIMIIPFILSLSDDALASVPQSIRDASLALGSTQAETITKIVLPSASAGILSGILLAISRAVGETMIVTMAAGMQAKLTLNPLDSVTTFTVQIVSLLVGDQEFDSPKTLSAFALALTLFCLTLLLNIWAILSIRKQRKFYGN